LAADHAAHVRALAALGAVPSATATSAPPTASPPAAAAPTAATALSLLAQRERAEVAARLTGLTALDGRTARLMASLAACSSAHLPLLARLPGTPAAPTKTQPRSTRKAGA
jgi:hypothetical protein